MVGWDFAGNALLRTARSAVPAESRACKSFGTSIKADTSAAEVFCYEYLTCELMVIMWMSRKRSSPSDARTRPRLVDRTYAR